MTMRSTKSTVTFSNPFTLSGYPGELPAGDYEVIVKEELLRGLELRGLPTDSDVPDSARQRQPCGTLRVAGDLRQRLERGAEPRSR